jgi:hypothetical protein
MLWIAHDHWLWLAISVSLTVFNSLMAVPVPISQLIDYKSNLVHIGTRAIERLVDINQSMMAMGNFTQPADILSDYVLLYFVRQAERAVTVMALQVTAGGFSEQAA